MTAARPGGELHLLRHAKSSWDDSGLADHDRPLAPRGRRAAARLGRHLRDAGIEPALVLCSSARRAQETLALLELAAPVSVEPGIYGASTGVLRDLVRGAAGDLPSLMLIGHNPGIEGLAGMLAAESPLRTLMLAKFPTGALATLRFAGGWGELDRGAAALTAFVRPRELDD